MRFDSIRRWSEKFGNGFGLGVSYLTGMLGFIAQVLELTTWTRTLSMTLGRPVSIPESFVRVGLPQVVEDTQASTMSTGNSKEDPTSVQFFTATM